MKKALLSGVTAAALILGMIAGTARAVAVNPCFTTLDDSFRVHIPAVAVDTAVFTADLGYAAAGPAGAPGMWFTLDLATVGPSAVAGCSNPARLFAENAAVPPTLRLRLPVVIYGQTTLWAELQFVQTTDGQYWFKVLAFGLMPNRVFVTSTKGGGNLSSWDGAGGKTGLEAADAICQARAAVAGLPGNYRAWISDTNSDAYCRIHGLTGKKSAKCGTPSLPASAGPWVRTDGFPFSGNVSELVNDVKVIAPASTDENALGVLSDDGLYFTNTWTDGTLSDPLRTCNDMTSSDDTVQAVGGIAFDGGIGWTKTWGGYCAGAFKLLCFQTGSGPSLPPYAMPGKRAFVSSASGSANLGSWPSAGGAAAGVNAGDAICRSLATGAGLPNASNFKAWLSTSAINARDRIASDGPWVRLDGVPVANSKADLIDGTLFAPINITQQNATLLVERAWTGTRLDGTKQSGTCGDWMQATPASTSDVGVTYDAGQMWADWNTYTCDASSHLYCFED